MGMGGCISVDSVSEGPLLQMMFYIYFLTVSMGTLFTAHAGVYSLNTKKQPPTLKRDM